LLHDTAVPHPANDRHRQAPGLAPLQHLEILEAKSATGSVRLFAFKYERGLVTKRRLLVPT
jgi:hypothetical protein